MEHLTGDAVATAGDSWSQIALQGPISAQLLADVMNDQSLAEMKPFRFVDLPWNGHVLRVATTGYTGSGGLNLPSQLCGCCSLGDLVGGWK